MSVLCSFAVNFHFTKQLRIESLNEIRQRAEEQKKKVIEKSVSLSLSLSPSRPFFYPLYHIQWYGGKKSCTDLNVRLNTEGSLINVIV
jgi:hypothetical protein